MMGTYYKKYIYTLPICKKAGNVLFIYYMRGDPYK
jgi:hypothetical protein